MISNIGRQCLIERERESWLETKENKKIKLLITEFMEIDMLKENYLSTT